jgi:hypothetical protein
MPARESLVSGLGALTKLAFNCITKWDSAILIFGVGDIGNGRKSEDKCFRRFGMSQRTGFFLGCHDVLASAL